MYHLHTICRACGSTPVMAEGIKAAGPASELVKVVDLGLQPLANDFCQGKDERSGYAPLEVMLCPKCNLAQLSVNVRPDILYSKYAYQTSQSQTMVSHFEALARDLNPEAKTMRVLEIGSNDGYFLEFWRHRFQGSHVMGIDPAANLVKLARDRGVPTLEGLFDADTADTAAQAVTDPDLIIARHVFCHVENWHEFINNLTRICAKNTTVAIEVPYVPDMLEKGSFDQIYHEHLSYLSLKSMVALLEGSTLYLQNVLRLPVHGGVVVMILRRRDCEIPQHSNAALALKYEKCGLGEWTAFAQKAKDQIATLTSLVSEFANQGKRVCGYGASAKSTVWINACKFTKRQVNYVMDSTATKVFKSIPGTNIPVVHEGTHIFDAADYCILFAWNYAAEILAREVLYIAGGGKFILPIPQVQILPD